MTAGTQKLLRKLTSKFFPSSCLRWSLPEKMFVKKSLHHTLENLPRSCNTPIAIERFAEAGRKRPQPEVYLRADQNVPYRYVAETLADASKGGLSKVAFVSEPTR